MVHHSEIKIYSCCSFYCTIYKKIANMLCSCCNVSLHNLETCKGKSCLKTLFCAIMLYNTILINVSFCSIIIFFINYSRIINIFMAYLYAATDQRQYV